MKGVYESLRQKELELQRALDDAAQANERELRRIQKSLQDALRIIDQLLGATAPEADFSPLSAVNIGATESKTAERSNPVSVSEPKARSAQSTIAACVGDSTVREFP